MGQSGGMLHERDEKSGGGPHVRVMTGDSAAQPQCVSRLSSSEAVVGAVIVGAHPMAEGLPAATMMAPIDGKERDTCDRHVSERAALGDCLRILRVAMPGHHLHPGQAVVGADLAGLIAILERQFMG